MRLYLGGLLSSQIRAARLMLVYNRDAAHQTARNQ